MSMLLNHFTQGEPYLTMCLVGLFSLYTGKPGAGKSYGALVAIIEELLYGHRSIVTNVSLNLSELCALLHPRGVDVLSRVRLITREDTVNFWRFRPNFTVLPIEHQRKIRGVVESSSDTADVEFLSEKSAPCVSTLYVIDEAHVAFDSRKWAKTAAALTFYNSQHRKLDDCGIFVTQFIKLIEGRVRNFCEFFHVYRNFASVRLMTFFAMPKRMRELVYCVEPGPGVVPDVERWRKLDPKYAACYDTMGGVGIAGGRKAEVRRNHGFTLSVWWIFVLLAVVGALVKAAVYFIPRAVVRTHTEAATVSSEPVSALGKAKASPEGNWTAPGSRPGLFSGLNPERLPSVKQPVLVTGILERAGHVVVTMSDGTVARDNQIQARTPDYVVIQGRTVWKAPASTGRARPVTARSAGPGG